MPMCARVLPPGGGARQQQRASHGCSWRVCSSTRSRTTTQRPACAERRACSLRRRREWPNACSATSSSRLNATRGDSPDASPPRHPRFSAAPSRRVGDLRFRARSRADRRGTTSSSSRPNTTRPRPMARCAGARSTVSPSSKSSTTGSFAPSRRRTVLPHQRTAGARARRGAAGRGHVHNLLNLSFDLPRLASERGAVVAATVHDYTLVCPSGGQRVHVAEQHVCAEIDPARCSRCFAQSPFHSQMAAGRLTRSPGGRSIGRLGLMLRRLAPGAAAVAARSIGGAAAVSPADIRRRLASARHVFETVDLFVAPSAPLAPSWCASAPTRGGWKFSDYGFHVAVPQSRARPGSGPLRIGFVGTLVWHKGVHVLLEAARSLRGDFEIHLHGDATVFPEYVATLRRAAAGCRSCFTAASTGQGSARSTALSTCSSCRHSGPRTHRW